MNTFRITFKYALDGENQIRTQNVDIGLIQSLENSYNIKTKTATLPTQPSQNAFALDYGVTRVYTMPYLRISPPEPVDDIEGDSTLWSNGFWSYVIKKYVVNRWQMQTDGCGISFTSKDEARYPSLPLTNVYVSSFSVEQIQGATNTLKGSVTFTIGSSMPMEDNTNRRYVVFDSNFTGNGAVDVNNQANIVKTTTETSMSVIEVPTEWITLATQYGIYAGSSATDEEKKAWFRWNTLNNGQGLSYKQGQQINLPVATTMLFARFNKVNPD